MSGIFITLQGALKVVCAAIRSNLNSGCVMICSLSRPAKHVSCDMKSRRKRLSRAGYAIKTHRHSRNTFNITKHTWHR